MLKIAYMVDMGFSSNKILALVPNWTLIQNLALLPYPDRFPLNILQRLRLVNRWHLLPRTPGPFQFWDLYFHFAIHAAS